MPALPRVVWPGVYSVGDQQRPALVSQDLEPAEQRDQLLEGELPGVHGGPIHAANNATAKRWMALLV
jgi:hypothetical protein